MGCAADKVSSKKTKQWQCNAGRIQHRGSPMTFCSELRKMGLTAKGTDCYDNLVGSFDDLLVKPVQRRSYCMDGEGVYQGDGTTADTVKSLVWADDLMNEVLHDPPHSRELLQDDMRKKFLYILEIHEIVKQMYSHLSFKGKALSGLQALASTLGVEWHELHYLFAIQMVESEYIALVNFMKDYPVIIKYLEGEIKKAEGSNNSSVQCQASQMKHWLRRMKEFKFTLWQ